MNRSCLLAIHWNSFDWQMFLAQIHSPKASFWDWSLRQSFGR